MVYNKNRVLAAILRTDFGSFIAKVFATINPSCKYHNNWHIDLIARHLKATEGRQIKRLIINIPPRSLKSICVNVAWPAWLLGKDPTTRIMNASYSSILSVKHSLDTRLVMESAWYKKLFPATKLSKVQNQKNKFLTTKNGFRFGVGIGGSATGEGADFLIIDDPHNPTEIHSDKRRNRVINWFEQTFASRLNDKNNGAIVLVMQRLAQDDLSGHLEASGNWNMLKIPAIAPKTINYDFGTFHKTYEENELLNISCDKKETLDNTEQEIGSRNYAAQYLQEPLPYNYNMLSVENIHHFEEQPRQFDFFTHSWDTAIKLSENSSYSVGTFWGVIKDQYYLLGMIRKKLSYPDLKNEIEKQINKYKPRFVLIEDKASGQALIQDLKRTGFACIKAIKPMVDKVTRFASIVNLFENGRAQVPSKSGYYRELITELTTFPNSKNDDIVDSVSQFLNFMKDQVRNDLIRIRML